MAQATKTTSRTTKQKAASAKATASRRRASAQRTAASAKAKASEQAAAPQGGLDRAREAAEQALRQVERAVVVQVGAVLEARDTVSGTIEDIQTRYGSSEAAEKQVKRFEKRGTKARKQVERRVKKTRTRVERELKTRRRKAEKRVTSERKRVEREARTAVKRANERADEVREAIRNIDLANGQEFIQTQVEQAGKAVQSGIDAGTEAVKRASERIAA